jgi:hypothetical protein
VIVSYDFDSVSLSDEALGLGIKEREKEKEKEKENREKDLFANLGLTTTYQVRFLLFFFCLSFILLHLLVPLFLWTATSTKTCCQSTNR